MFAGYGIIACPLVLSHNSGIENLTELVECPRCYRRLHQEDANFCRVCGTALRQPRVKSIKAKIRRERLQQLRTPIKTTPASAAIPIPNSVTSAEETVDMIEEVHSHQLR
jgi:ribosomal protein L37E